MYIIDCFITKHVFPTLQILVTGLICGAARPSSTFSHTHKVGNNVINASFVFQYICSFLHYLYLKIFSKCKIKCQLVKGITFQGCSLYWSFEF